MTTPQGPQQQTSSSEGVVPPQPTEQQKRAIHFGASQLVVAAVTGLPARLTDPTLGGTAQQPVSGSFVTLKREGRLRGCCGCYGKTTSLVQAVKNAAPAAATRDYRMPSVTRSELPCLDLTVSLLHTIVPMTARGEDRIRQVRVGTHGLHITKGNARGLLLPVVAVEYGFSAAEFLRQVCLKAGLPATAWEQDDARLETFQCIAITGPLDQAALSPDAAEGKGEG